MFFVSLSPFVSTSISEPISFYFLVELMTHLASITLNLLNQTRMGPFHLSDSATRNKLSTVNEKLTRLERKMEYVWLSSILDRQHHLSSTILCHCGFMRLVFNHRTPVFCIAAPSSPLPAFWRPLLKMSTSVATLLRNNVRVLFVARLLYFIY